MKAKFLFFSILIYFLMFFYSSLFSQDFYETLNDNIDTVSTSKNMCILLKSENFEGIPYKDRLILLYLNNLLDYIVAKNTSIIGSRKLCILKNFNPYEQISGFSASGNGLIRITIDEDLYLYLQNSIYSDASIVAMLSHEIAHLILNHHEKLIELSKDIYRKYFLTKPSEEQEKLDPFEFCLEHPEYIALAQKFEEEADTLGFIIYLNSGFKIDDYKKQFIRVIVENSSMDFSSIGVDSQRAQLFKELLSKSKDPTLSLEEKINATISILLQKLEEAKKKSKEALDQFMSDIKYIDPDKYLHPTGFWRYLNIYKLEKELLKSKNKDMTDHDTVDTVYFRIDLTNSKRLEEVRRFFNQQNISSINLDYTDLNDPRSYIIDELLASINPDPIFPKTTPNTEIIRTTPQSSSLAVTDNDTVIPFLIAGPNGETIRTRSDLKKLLPQLLPDDESTNKLFSEFLQQSFDNDSDKASTTAEQTTKRANDITFTVVTDQKNRSDVGRLRDDNSIILKANDIFKIAVILSILEQINCKTCTDLFTEDPSSSQFEVPKEIKQKILNAELNNNIRALFI